MGMPACAGFWPVMTAILTSNVLKLGYGTGDYKVNPCSSYSITWYCRSTRNSNYYYNCSICGYGFPVEMVVILAQISSLADMGRTSTNVTASSYAAVIVAASEDELDREIYNS